MGYRPCSSHFVHYLIYTSSQDKQMHNHAMASKASLSLIFVVFTSILGISYAQVCSDRGNFTTNSTYERNRDIVLSSLASNVTANDYSFTTTVGQGQDRVYGLALCRKDATPQACSSCVNSGIQGLKDTCQVQKEAFSWSGDPICLIRYANRSFFGILELKPDKQGYNVDNITSDMEQFDQVWTEFTDRLVSEASRGTSKLKYASGETNLTGNKNLYAVMTCTPDLSQSNCSTCLQTAVSEYKNCCRGHQGGYSNNPNCYFRWDLYPFFIPDASTPGSPPTNPIIGKKGVDSRTVVIIALPAIIFVGLLGACFAAFVYRRKMKLEIENVEERGDAECLQFSFATIKIATNNFSGKNKLGRGGFGAVYKGVLPNGRIIAVKRLSINSRQGEAEFKNEVIFVARLQHRNLVRLLGFCLEGKERLLIYEFLPNKSLDCFIFDATKREMLDWDTRRQIIIGIARGVLYLHQDSQFRIVHRDLKASNILLDEDMNPKISDFGMAKLVGIDQSEDTASRIVGTFGYMAPEYAMRGHFSVKSDVFSFGVLVLEIISGEKINSFRGEEEDEDLLTFAWKNWNKGTALNLTDPTLLRTGPTDDMITIIHIALLCVQQNVTNRPTMASVVLMLSSGSLTLPTPTRPAFFLHSSMGHEALSFTEKISESTMSLQSKSSPASSSINEASITELKPR